MTTYGPRHAIEDRYGQDVTVDVETKDGSVCLGITAYVVQLPPRVPRTRRETTTSKLTPEQACRLADQLEAAADEAERYG